MLVCKISPSASIVSQLTPFEHLETSAPYMTVVANQYVPNADSTTFNIIFGNLVSPVPAEDPQPSPFIVLYTYSLTLTKAQLSTWGTDDDELLQIIANQIGTTILEFVNIP